MIDASRGFIKDGPKNRLRAQDLHRIVDTFRKGDTVPRHARLVGLDEIEKNDYNLNLPRYIDSSEPEDLQDIEGHLKGGIPQADVDALHAYWSVCPELKAALFKPNRPGYVDLAVDKNAIKTTIYSHSQFAAFIRKMNTHFTAWRNSVVPTLRALQPGCHPKDIITQLSESLLAHYANQPLIDAYDIYQHLMDYWHATMQDDCYLIAADGWRAQPSRVIEKDKKGKTKDKGWACDLVPKALIVARYFADDAAAIDHLQAELDSLAARLTELEEEHSGDDATFAGFDKINRANVASRLKEIRGDQDALEEAAVLTEGNRWNAEETELKRRLKDAEAALDAQAVARYAGLSEDEVKVLVVEDKWMGVLDADVHGEMARVSQGLTQRVSELAERYGDDLHSIADMVVRLEAKTNSHLEKMGW